jgi:hypothetical protein
MGAFVSRTWFIYARDENDRWLQEPLASTLTHEDDYSFHMGRFKHFVFKLGLGRLTSLKIYLYKGFRVAKAVRKAESVDVIFYSKEAAEAWNTCKRSQLGQAFDLEFQEVDQPDAFKHVFNRIEDSQSAED